MLNRLAITLGLICLWASGHALGDGRFISAFACLLAAAANLALWDRPAHVGGGR